MKAKTKVRADNRSQIQLLKKQEEGINTIPADSGRGSQVKEGEGLSRKLQAGGEDLDKGLGLGHSLAFLR